MPSLPRAKAFPANFVAEFSLPTNLRSVFAAASDDAYPLRTVPGLRVDGDGGLGAFVAE